MRVRVSVCICVCVLCFTFRGRAADGVLVERLEGEAEVGAPLDPRRLVPALIGEGVCLCENQVCGWVSNDARQSVSQPASQSAPAPYLLEGQDDAAGEHRDGLIACRQTVIVRFEVGERCTHGGTKAEREPTPNT